MSFLEHSLQIGKARIQNPGFDAKVLRLRAEHAVGLADIRLPGLPPSSLVFIRRLRDPAPGSLRLQSAGAPSRAWERAMRERLAQLVAAARRPAVDAVGANAEAVIFADMAEMLACFARDRVRGEAAGRWWWRSLLRQSALAPGEGLARMLARNIRVLPAALRHLSEWGEAARVLRMIPVARCMDLLGALGQEYHLSLPPGLALGRPAAAPSRRAPGADKPGMETQRPWLGRTSADSSHRPFSGCNSPPAFTPAEPPWRGLIEEPAEAASLPWEARSLLGLGLCLHRRPAVVRDSAFQAAFGRWCRESANPPPQEPPSTSSADAYPAPPAPSASAESLRSVPPTPVRQPLDAALAPHPRPAPPVPPPLAVRRRPDGKDGIREAAASTAGRPNGPVSPAPASPPSARLPETASGQAGLGVCAADSIPRAAPGWDAAGVPPAPDEGNVALPPTWVLPGEGGDAPAVSQDTAVFDEASSALPNLENGVDTDLGGALYLINMLVGLDLPACFEEEWALASRLGAWGTLEALCRGLLAGQEAYADDPLWPALALLEGRRPGTLLGSDLLEPEAFRLPPTWPAKAGDHGPWEWAEEGAGLRLWSVQGYRLAEIRRCRADAGGEAAELAAAYGGLTPPVPRPLAEMPQADPVASLAAEVAPALQSWLARVLPFIRLRLRKGIGHRGDAAGLAAAVLCHPGRLYATGSHVDLVLRLEHASLDLRRAGLDRNPGWLPEFGRVVLFHFE